MEGSSRFTEETLRRLRSDTFDGRSMIDTSRSILLAEYSDDEYNMDFFSIFNLLVDEGLSEEMNYFDIEKLYMDSFLSSILDFRKFFGV